MKNTVFGIAVVGFAVATAINVLCMLVTVFLDPPCVFTDQGLEFAGWTTLLTLGLGTVLRASCCLISYRCGYKRRALHHELTTNAAAWCVVTLVTMLCCTSFEGYWLSSMWLDRDINTVQVVIFVVVGTIALISFRHALLGLTTGDEPRSFIQPLISCLFIRPMQSRCPPPPHR